jgi:hypothetical protein
MNAMAVAQRMTADEYLSIEDPRRTELVEGEVIVHSLGRCTRSSYSTSSVRSMRGSGRHPNVARSGSRWT